jgi:hypothetical protein
MRRLSFVVLALVAVGSIAILVAWPAREQQATTSASRAVESAAAPQAPRDHAAPAFERTPEAPLTRRKKAETRTGEVSFEDGTRVPITMRPVHLTSPPFALPERLVDRYAELVRLAQGGHPGAARSLFKWLKLCQRAPQDQASLDRAIERLHATREVTWSDPSRPMKLRPGVDLKEFEKVELRQPYEFCQGVTAEQKAEAEQWLQVAVETGDMQSVQEYAAGLGITREALEVWERLWQKQGFRSSLQPLAIIYSKGVEGTQPDYVRAYAYLLIEQKLLELVDRESGVNDQRIMLASMDDVLRHMGGYLNPQQTEAAAALAKQLLVENPNCCSGSLFGVTW